MLYPIAQEFRRLRANPGRALASTAVLTLVGLATRHVAEAAWHTVQGEPPPRDPSHSDVSWPKAVAWTTALGMAVGIARLATRRSLNVVR